MAPSRAVARHDLQVHERLLRAPAWMLAVVHGVFFGVFFGVFMAAWSRVLDGQSWTRALVTAALAALFAGAITGVVQHRQLRRAREVATRSPHALSPEIRRASWRGPVPADPVVRGAAHDLLRAQLEPLERQRRWAAVFFALLVVRAVVLALTDNASWWWAAVAWAGPALAHRCTLVRLRRRVDVLAPARQA